MGRPYSMDPHDGNSLRLLLEWARPKRTSWETGRDGEPSRLTYQWATDTKRPSQWAQLEEPGQELPKEHPISTNAGVGVAASAAVELARIPLVRRFFAMPGAFWKALGFIAILLAGGLATGNLIFGFERAFVAHIQEINQISQRAVDANAKRTRLGNELQALIKQRDAVQTAIRQLDEKDKAEQAAANDYSTRTQAANMQERTTEVGRQLTLDREWVALHARHKNELARAMAVCRAYPERCRLGALQRQQQRELTTLNKERASTKLALQHLDDAYNHQRTQDDDLRTDKQTLDTQRAPLNARVDMLNAQIDKAQTDLENAKRAANDADTVAQSARSQMNRLARFFNRMLL